jgi:4-hydroxybenzoate polyprenyltransferase
MGYLQLMRPHQWVKNVFVFAGLVFGKKLLDGQAVFLSLVGFACMCLVSSAVYVFNDIHDRHEDRLHPSKSSRPIAAGRVGVGEATLLGALLVIIGLGASFRMNIGFGLVVLSYLVMQALYTAALKNMAILDVVIIATGFVLRAISGAVLVNVEISHWLVVCTFTLCLFMGFSKRRCELNVLNGAHGYGRRAGDRETGGAELHRRTLASYTPDLLNQMTTMTAGIAVISFMLYATDERTVSPVTGFGNHFLIYTLPPVVYAVFRFALLVEHGKVDGPTDVMLRDRPFQVTLLIWGVSVMLLVYRGRELEEWVKGLGAES